MTPLKERLQTSHTCLTSQVRPCRHAGDLPNLEWVIQDCSMVFQAGTIPGLLNVRSLIVDSIMQEEM